MRLTHPARTQAPLLRRLRLGQRGVGLRLPAVRRLLACAQGAPGSGPDLRARMVAAIARLLVDGLHL